MQVFHHRPTWIEIDLSNIKHNFLMLKRRLCKGTKILAVVKADAYGHGMVRVSRLLSALGVDYLGISNLDEAIELREARVATPILLLDSLLPSEVKHLSRWRIIPSVSSRELAQAIAAEAGRQRKIIPVHIKIDTGMGRFGIWWKEAIEFVESLSGLKGIKLSGIYTHFPDGEKKDSYFTQEQIKRFSAIVDELEKRGIRIPERHAANSMGLVGFRDSHFTLVRPGLMLYGLYPDDNLKRRLRLQLRPALALKTRIIFLKKVARGRSIGYGRTYITKHPTLIATIPVGYADGYSRALSNKAKALIRGKAAPVAGRICMDHTMVDVGGIRDVKLGDEVVLIGRQGRKEISAESLAGLSGTIPYEVVTSLSPRIPRRFKGK